MRIDQAFKKAGFEILEAKKENKQLTFKVRIPLQNPIVPSRWKRMLESVLVGAEGVAAKPNVKWEIDISKRFYSRNGVVRYIWRVVMSGDLASCSVALVAATLDALRTGNELTDVPLVGAQTSPPDPANGRFKGAYPRGEEDRASHVIASAFTAGMS